MPFKRWDPFFDLISLHNDLFGEGRDQAFGEPRQAGWSPDVDIFETAASFVIKIELPGVDPDLVRIEYHNKHLIIMGQKKGVKEPNNRYYLVERVYGPFRKAFALPECIDSENIDAQYEDGVLEIVVPKTKENDPKCIPIQAAP